MPSNADIAREVRRSYGMTDPVDGTHAMSVIESPNLARTIAAHADATERLASAVDAVAANRPVVKDSGEREHFGSGMQRDTEKDKIDYVPLLTSEWVDRLAVLVASRPDIDWGLVFDGPMFEEWAQHLTDGAKKYEARNWMRAISPEEMARFRRSSARHYVAWLRGKKDERHHAGVCFNVNGALYVEQRLGEQAVDYSVGATPEEQKMLAIVARAEGHESNGRAPLGPA